MRIALVILSKFVSGDDGWDTPPKTSLYLSPRNVCNSASSGFLHLSLLHSCVYLIILGWTVFFFSSHPSSNIVQFANFTSFKMQFAGLFVSLLLSIAVAAQANKATKAVTDMSLCKEMASLNKFVSLAGNTTKIDAKAKNNATKSTFICFLSGRFPRFL